MGRPGCQSSGRVKELGEFVPISTLIVGSEVFDWLDIGGSRWGLAVPMPFRMRISAAQGGLLTFPREVNDRLGRTPFGLEQVNQFGLGQG